MTDTPKTPAENLAGDSAEVTATNSTADTPSAPPSAVDGASKTPPAPPATPQSAAPAEQPQPEQEQTGPFSPSTGPATPFTATGGAAAGAASVTRRYRPLFGTILWGVILLAFAAFMVIWTIVPATLDPSLWLLGGVIAVGLVLVVAGIAAASRRAG